MINTTLCYIERDGKYLMMHRTRKQNDLNHDKWIGIGGKFENKESPEDCVLREALEETGLTLSPENGRIAVSYRGHDYFCDVWIFSEDHRKIVKTWLLDGATIDEAAEKHCFSGRHGSDFRV